MKVDCDKLASMLAEIVGQEHVRPVGQEPSGAGVRLWAAPGDLEQAAEIVRLAGRRGFAVLPWGAGTKARYLRLGGLAGREPVVGVMTHRLNCVVEYAPDDLTVTVQAGMTLQELDRLLAGHNQRLPLDPPHMAQATVGGVIASNESGPLRFGHGAVRDMILGMRAVQPDGRINWSGAKVVKNVAGFAVHRLLIGSWGSLGLIGEVCFMLRPRAERFRLVRIVVDRLGSVEPLLATVLEGETRPVLVELVNARAARDIASACEEDEAEAHELAAVDRPGGLLLVGYEGPAETVDWQCGRLMLAAGVQAAALDPEASGRIWRAVREWPISDGGVAFRANVLSSHVANLFAELDDGDVGLLAHAGNGVVCGKARAETAEDVLARLMRWLAGRPGNVLVTNAPDGGPSPRWMREPTDESVMRVVKERFDPHRTFAVDVTQFMGAAVQASAG